MTLIRYSGTPFLFRVSIMPHRGTELYAFLTSIVISATAHLAFAVMASVVDFPFWKPYCRGDSVISRVSRSAIKPSYTLAKLFNRQIGQLLNCEGRRLQCFVAKLSSGALKRVIVLELERRLVAPVSTVSMHFPMGPC